MSYRSSCIIQEFPVSEREYQVSAPERWEGRPVCRRPSRRKRRIRLLPALLALALVFSFLLGRASARSFRLLRPHGPERDLVQSDGTQELGAASQAAGVPVAVLPAEPQGPAEAGAPATTVLPAEPQEPAETPWNLVLINYDHSLPEDFTAPALTQLANGHAVDSRIYPDLQRMMDDAKAAGVNPTICSSFRTWDKQESLYKNKIQRLLNAGWDPETVEQEAARWVARPGTSEHQAGLAVDIVDKAYMALDQKQETTAAQKWLMAHCAEYGFILRYPNDKGDLTGVGYEPWHYRYVGVEAAQAIMEQGICLEEYLSNHP